MSTGQGRRVDHDGPASETLAIFNDAGVGIRRLPDGGFEASTRIPFMLFASAVARRFGRGVLVTRTADEVEARPIALPDIDIAALPGYESLRDLPRLARVLPGTMTALWRSLDDVDRVWVMGPHPFGFVLVAMAVARRRPCVLGVRMDSIAYTRSRLDSRRWWPALAAAEVAEHAHRLAARRLRTVVVGPALARAYRRGTAPVLEIAILMLSAADLAPAPRPQLPLESPVRLLSVGRIAAEKNPMLLLDAMAELERRAPGRYTLDWVGSGPLEAALRDRIAERGLGDVVRCHGFVPFGDDLLDRYRSADIFVHVALTEGLPQVICEAQALGIPIIATDVGGIREATGAGRTAITVPPKDVGALVTAVEKLARDDARRHELSSAGLAQAREITIDVQADRVAQFIASPRRPAA